MLEVYRVFILFRGFIELSVLYHASLGLPPRRDVLVEFGELTLGNQASESWGTTMFGIPVRYFEQERLDISIWSEVCLPL